MGLEGIVSKRIDAPYRSGRSKTWVKVKNPNAPGMLRFKGMRKARAAATYGENDVGLSQNITNITHKHQQHDTMRDDDVRDVRQGVLPP